MAPLNKKTRIFTHEGAVAKTISPVLQLRRLVLSTLLWEDQFYVDGKSIADQILATAKLVDGDTLAAITIEARTKHGLRHVPLLLLQEVIRRGGAGVATTIANTITRPDEMTELLAIYWKDGKKPITNQMRKGLAKAFHKFNEYSLAKYNRDGAVKLRDVLFLSHAKPRDAGQEALFKRLANNELAVPNTWEVRLSAAGNDSVAKREIWEDLIKTEQLGYLALLRNVRNMDAVGVDRNLINNAIIERKGSRYVFPFRYVASARVNPQFEPAIDTALVHAVSELPKLDGKTIVLVDVSGSMNNLMSAKSDLKRMDAAAALASVINADDLRVFSFSNSTVEVPARRGMAGVDAVIKSQSHQGTRLGEAVRFANSIPHDRLIVITDEQSSDVVSDPVAKNAYMVNIASNKNGVGYGKWKHVDGFSEGILKWIHELEAEGTE